MIKVATSSSLQHLSYTKNQINATLYHPKIKEIFKLFSIIKQIQLNSLFHSDEVFPLI